MDARGCVEVVQLDYFTGEYIDEYSSTYKASKDNLICEGSVAHSISRKRRMRNNKLFFIKKSEYSESNDYSLRLKLKDSILEIVKRIDNESYEILDADKILIRVKFENGDILDINAKVFETAGICM